jgi:quinoprotein glucose dehydrogenase
MNRKNILISATVAFALAASWVLAATGTIWDGVYTKEQAAKGQATYGEECARCHAENLSGGEGNPELVGDTFLQRWDGKTAADLFGIIRTMPLDAPGSLTRQQYANLMAFILSFNNVPAGSSELKPDENQLKQVLIVAKRP